MWIGSWVWCCENQRGHIIGIFLKYIFSQKNRNDLISYLNGLIGSCDESDEQRQNHVDEEGDEAVQVNLAEQPHQSAALLHLRERHEHVVPVNEGEQALRYHGQRAELRRENRNQTSANSVKGGVNRNCYTVSKA